MKKLIIYLSIIVIIFAGLFVVNQQSQKAQDADNAGNPYGKPASKLHPETAKLLKNPNYQNIILPEELDKKISNKEDFFTYYWASDCPHCMRTTPVLNPIAKEANVDIKQFNLREFQEGWDKYKIEYTPTLVYYKGGKEVDRMVGGVPDEGSKEGNTPEKFKAFIAKYKAQ